MGHIKIQWPIEQLDRTLDDWGWDYQKLFWVHFSETWTMSRVVFIWGKCPFLKWPFHFPTVSTFVKRLVQQNRLHESPPDSISAFSPSTRSAVCFFLNENWKSSIQIVFLFTWNQIFCFFFGWLSGPSKTSFCRWFGFEQLGFECGLETNGWINSYIVTANIKSSIRWIGTTVDCSSAMIFCGFSMCNHTGLSFHFLYFSPWMLRPFGPISVARALWDHVIYKRRELSITWDVVGPSNQPHTIRSYRLSFDRADVLGI